MNEGLSQFMDPLPPHVAGSLMIVPHGDGFRVFHRGEVEFCHSPTMLLLAVSRWRRALKAEAANESEAAS